MPKAKAPASGTPQPAQLTKAQVAAFSKVGMDSFVLHFSLCVAVPPLVIRADTHMTLSHLPAHFMTRVLCDTTPQVFRYFDQDNNGSIAAAEIYSQARSLGLEVSIQEVGTIQPHARSILSTAERPVSREQ